jgi:hypothetical protein
MLGRHTTKTKISREGRSEGDRACLFKDVRTYEHKFSAGCSPKFVQFFLLFFTHTPEKDTHKLSL